MNIQIINGPNLNLLGLREPEIYGRQSFEAFFSSLQEKYPEHELSFFQSNDEGALVNAIQTCLHECDGVILNAGGFSHTSVAIADAVAMLRIPVIEVHITNVFARESFRHESRVAKRVRGVISGLGLEGYEIALGWFLLSQD